MDLEEKKTFLRQVKVYEPDSNDPLYIFRDLTEQELGDLALLVESYTFSRGGTLAFEGDVANRLLMVHSGIIEALNINEQLVITGSHTYRPFDAFKDVWLFTPSFHTHRLRAVEDGMLLTISEEAMARWLTSHATGTLDLTRAAAEAFDQFGVTKREELRYRQFTLLPDETVVLESRRSKWVLLYQTVLPVLLLISVAAVAVWLAFALDLPAWIEGALAAVLVVGPIILIIFQVLDWYLDWLLITNKFVIHREFELRTFAGAVDKLPIERVQSVNLERPGLIQTLFGIGNIRITTAAQDVALVFKNVSNPDRVEQQLQNVIREVRQRERRLGQARDQKAIRRSIENHFNLEPHMARATDDEDIDDVVAPGEQPSWLRRKIGYRVVEGTTITFRRHWIVFARHALWYLLALALWVMIVVGGQVLVPGILISPIFGGVMVFFLFIILFALYWYYADWRNDIYRLTTSTVIDSTRLPLGFGSSRTEAPLANVQNVNVLQPNIWSTLLRYGDVTVETAGANANIIFKTVHRPKQVQADLFQRLERVKQQETIRRGESRRREFIQMMGVFRQVENRLPSQPDDSLPDRNRDPEWYEV